MPMIRLRSGGKARNQLVTPGGRRVLREGPYVQYFQTLSNTFFQRGAKNFLRGASPPLCPLVTVLMGGGTILLETLEDPDDPSPSTKCCPELAKHLDISLGVDCHRPLAVVLEPEWSNDAMFGYGNRSSNATIRPLIKLQNKAIKIINPTNTGSLEEHFQHLNILCLPKLYSFSVGRFMHSYHNQLLSNHFDE